MKTPFSKFIATLAATSSAGLLHAEIYTWNGSTTGALGGTDNVWDTATENWIGFDTLWPSTSTGDDDAVFAGTPGTVTLTTAVTANSITFSQTINTSYTVGADNTTGVITLDGTTPTIASAGSASSNIIGAALNGSAGLTKSGNRTLQLRGVNTYTGDTRVLNGKLLIGLSNNRLPTGTTLILGDPVANTNGVFQMNSRSQQVAGLTTAGTGIGNRVINSSVTASTFTVNNSDDFTFAGILGGTETNDNNFNFTKSSSGRLTLTNINTFTGTTNITGGTLELGNATNTLPNAGAVNVNGGTLDIADKTDTVGALTVTAGSITGTTGVLTAASCAGKAGTVGTILASSTNLSGTATSWLTKDTAGTLELSAANTFTGNITITAGRLTLSNSGAVGSVVGTDSKGIIMQGGSRSLWLKGDITLPDFLDIFASSNSNDGGGINNESGDNEITGPINFSTGLGALNISSASDSLTISGDITMTSSARTLHLGGASITDNTISGNISESTSAIMPVIKQGAGKWILSGTNTYKGDTTVNGGTLVLADGGSQRFLPLANATSNKITGNGSGAITLDGALDFVLTGTGSAADAPNGTDWLIVDVTNLDETYGDNFTVTGFTETALDSGVWEKIDGVRKYTFTESTGLLEADAAGSPFQTWATTNITAIDAGADATATGDPDGDGSDNLAEFALAGDPLDSSDNGLTRFGIEDISGTDHLTLTFACRSADAFTGAGPASVSKDGVTYTVRGSTDLGTFTVPVDEVTAIPGDLPTAPVGYTYRTFRVTDAVSANPKAFIQLQTIATP